MWPWNEADETRTAVEAPKRFPKDKTVIYGLGAQKAGTTWLGDYVTNHPQCFLPPMKELHYFDVQTGSDTQARKVAVNNMKRTLEAMLTAEGEGYANGLNALQGSVHRAEIFAPGDRGLQAYLWHMTKDMGDASHLCDFTPSYSTCDKEAFAEMAALSDDARFVFIMRDPVQRLWSQARMVGKQAANRRNSNFEKASKHALKHFLGDTPPGQVPRSNYKRTIEELERAVPNDKILYLFYETLFTDASVKKFCDFVGISYKAADFSAQSNVGRSMSMPPRVEIELRRGLLEQYDYVRGRFGDAVPETWYDPARDPDPMVVPAPLKPKKTDKDAKPKAKPKPKSKDDPVKKADPGQGTAKAKATDEGKT